MAHWRLAERHVSYRWVTLNYGMNFRHIESLMRLSILVSSGRGVSLDSLEALVESEHYVVCAECGNFAGALTDRHLQRCSGITVSGYRKKHAGLRTECKMVERNRQKSDAQKAEQSAVLKARFQTPAGEITRKQIADAAKTSMASGYRERAIEHLRTMNADPVRRAATSLASKLRWASGGMHVVSAWHRLNKAASNAKIAHARGYIRRTFTKPHATLEVALLAAGLQVQREYQVRFYRIDEAIPELFLAIEMDGCYWHGCPRCGFPGLADIRNLDRRKTSYLIKRGWQIVRIRECDLIRDLQSCILQVLDAVKEISRARTA